MTEAEKIDALERELEAARLARAAVEDELRKTEAAVMRYRNALARMYGDQWEPVLRAMEVSGD